MTTPETQPSATLAELAQIVEDLSGGKVTTADPGVMRRLGSALSSARQYCGWRLWPRTSETITVDGSGARLLQLPSMKVHELLSVIERRGHDARVLSEFTDYSWSATGMLERSSGAWTRDLRGVTVELDHGLDGGDAEAVIGLLAEAVSRMGGIAASGGELAAVGQVRYQQTGGTAVAAGGRLFMRSELDVLDLYRVNAEA